METFAGLDWGFREHAACVVDGAGVVAEQSFAHGGAGLGSLAEWLRSLGGPAVAMETPRGPAASALLSRGIEVRSINPRQSDRFRDRHSPSGSKDDRRDARVLANALRTDPGALRRVAAETPEETALASLQRRLGWLREDRGRLESRLRSELWEFYPEFEAMVAELGVGLATEWVLALLGRLPRPGSVRGVRDATIGKALGRARKVDAAGVRAALSAPATPSGSAASRRYAACAEPRPSPSSPERAGASSAALPSTPTCATPCTTAPASPRTGTPACGPSTTDSGAAATTTPGRCAPSPTASSAPSAPSSPAEGPGTPPSESPKPPEPVRRRRRPQPRHANGRATSKKHLQREESPSAVPVTSGNG